MTAATAGDHTRRPVTCPPWPVIRQAHRLLGTQLAGRRSGRLMRWQLPGGGWLGRPPLVAGGRRWQRSCCLDVCGYAAVLAYRGVAMTVTVIGAVPVRRGRRLAGMSA